MGLIATVLPASSRRSRRARAFSNHHGAFLSIQQLEERTLLSGSFGSGQQASAPDMLEEEMRVNQQTEFLQTNSRYADQTVAGLRDGGFIATWTSQVQIGVDHSYAVVARRFDSSGAPVGDEYVVNQTIKGTQRFPTVYAGTTNGGQERVLFVWEAWEWGSLQIKARLFDAEGQALGHEFQVNDFDLRGTRHTGSVDFLDDHSFVIAWHGQGGGGWQTYDNYGVFMRKFDYNGNPLTGDILVNQTRIGRQELPSLHGLPNGDILVTWSGLGHGDWWGVYQRRFDSSGNALGGERLVNTMTWGVQYQPTLSVAPNGSYAIGFTGRGDTYMRLYDADGVAQGSEFRLNTYTSGRQHEPAITYIGDNRIVTTWSGYGPGDDYGIFKREFDGEGNPLAVMDDEGGGATTASLTSGSGHNGVVDDTIEQLVNVTTDGMQQFPSIAALANGGHVITWSGNGVGDWQGVFKRIYQDAFPDFNLYINPADPLILSAKLDDGTVIEYFGTKDENGLVESLDIIYVHSPEGQNTVIELDDQARPTRIVSNDGIVFEYVWINETRVQVTAIAANGSVQATVVVDLTPSAPVNESSGIANVPSNSVALAPSPRVSNAATTPFQSTQLTTNVSTPNVSLVAAAIATSTSIVNVTKCDGCPAEDATVTMMVTNDDGESFSLPGINQGNGQYAVSIPTSDSDPGATAEEVCDSFLAFLSLCPLVDAIPPGGEVQICAGVAAAIDLALGGPTGEGVAIAAACTAGIKAYQAACNLNPSPDPSAPGPIDFICDNIKEIVNRAAQETYTLTPVVTIPGGGSMIGTSQTVPAIGPFPTFDVAFSGDVSIDSFTVSPIDPGPGQSYVATAQVSCAVAEGVTVTMSIVGTDGYTDSTTCTITGDGTCSLNVPGAAAGVQDVITVSIAGGPTRQVSIVF